MYMCAYISTSSAVHSTAAFWPPARSFGCSGHHSVSVRDDPGRAQFSLSLYIYIHTTKITPAKIR